ncbi:exonuclease V isoform X2 [Varanus komodoensis]|uniref:exonuclease V isoform X2 n=1 Tax=Varanus komodoensis TaxID=61221 RepID=UPI001CF7C262|nr:exonuclease V isoform X2 [Varanus komodoensis]
MQSQGKGRLLLCGVLLRVFLHCRAKQKQKGRGRCRQKIPSLFGLFAVPFRDSKALGSGTPKRKRAQTPLEAFHLHHLKVTDLSEQVWCEQEMVYKRKHPDLWSPEKLELLNTGKSIHLARELEVHDLVPVHTTSREDFWAIKVLNLLLMIHDLQAEGIFVLGVIDQLGYTAKGELELSELKTRRKASMPTAAQKKRDGFQVFLYKYLFDAMVQGCLTTEAFLQHLHLRPMQVLGPHVQEQVGNAGLTVHHFQDLLELMSLRLTFSEIPAVERLQIEYVHQESNAPLGTELLSYNKDSVAATVQHLLAYWKGRRDAEGVDIEDAWKCHYCTYAGICDWRMNKIGRSPGKNWQKRSR